LPEVKKFRYASISDQAIRLLRNFENPWEPTIQDAIRTRADLVCFSGDKLFGGPQAGLIVGKRKFISQLLKDPLYRAFRLDKIALCLLERTLLSHLSGRLTPCWEMASIPIDELANRAQKISSLMGILEFDR